MLKALFWKGPFPALPISTDSKRKCMRGCGINAWCNWNALVVLHRFGNR